MSAIITSILFRTPHKLCGSAWRKVQNCFVGVDATCDELLLLLFNVLNAARTVTPLLPVLPTTGILSRFPADFCDLFVCSFSFFLGPFNLLSLRPPLIHNNSVVL
jgi:hypothetical protein